MTEAGDGEDGRIKSAIGIGSLLEDGIGDTIRVSLTEDPEFEIPVCNDLVRRYADRAVLPSTAADILSPSLLQTGVRKRSRPVTNIGGTHVPVVVADLMQTAVIKHEDLLAIGYTYDGPNDKWNIGDAAADYLYTGNKDVGFALPGTLKVICDHGFWLGINDKEKYFPLYQGEEYLRCKDRSAILNFISLDTAAAGAGKLVEQLSGDTGVVWCLWSSDPQGMLSMRQFIMDQMGAGLIHPVILAVKSHDSTIDEQLIHFSTEAGALFLDGLGDGIWLMNDPKKIMNARVSGRTYLETKNNQQFLNNTSFSILQATRTRISKTEYISCPSCGRTLFDLQETTARIRSVTHHLKGVKIAIMGCIVNGPGEMADADFGYVGSGPGKITLYRGKEVVKRGVDSAIAVEELIKLLKESEAWVDKLPYIAEINSP